MSDNVKAGCDTGCTTGVKLVTTKVPSLTSPKETFAGKRPCRGKSPFNVPWCNKPKGWPPGSMVHTKCGYFFNLERTTSNPDMINSQWYPFDFKLLFEKLLESMACDTCPSLSDAVKPWLLEEGVINKAMPGETWCFQTIDADGKTSHVFACAQGDEPVYDSPEVKPASWSAMSTPEALLCSLLSKSDKFVSVVTNENGSISITDTEGEVHTTPVAAEVKTCPLDYLTDKIIPKYRNTDADLWALQSDTTRWQGDATTVISDAGLAVDGSVQVVKTVTLTKPQLISLGMRATDNTIIISARPLVRMDIATEAGASQGVNDFLTIVKVSGCTDYAQGANAGTNSIEPNSGPTDEDSQSRELYRIPLAADGSVTIEYIARPELTLSDLNTIDLTYAYLVGGFTRSEPADLCYKGDDPVCLGVDTAG